MLPVDPDSLMYKIETEKFYEIFYKDDFSNYTNDPKYYSNSNNLILGKMKNETCETL